MDRLQFPSINTSKKDAVYMFRGEEEQSITTLK